MSAEQKLTENEALFGRAQAGFLQNRPDTGRILHLHQAL
jgi:hypothetical protein